MTTADRLEAERANAHALYGLPNQDHRIDLLYYMQYDRGKGGDMLTVRLEPLLEQQLHQLAKDTGRPKSFYVNEALTRYMDDRADYLTAVAALERGDEALSAADARRELGL